MEKGKDPKKDLGQTQTYIIKNKKENKKENKKPKKVKKAKKPSKHPKLKKAIKITALVLVLLILIGAGVVVGFGYQILKDAKLGMDDLIIKYENSIVKNAKGETIAVLNGEENREIIALSDMAEYLPIAFVSIEDERYYDHFGIDVKRTAGAAFKYVVNRGNYDFGGSTITQQLVKNLTQEKEGTVKRKITEMARAYYLEKELSKTQILELYLNLIFMGGTAHGVEIGSKYYFDKSSSELTLAECAFLAGINHSPEIYEPFNEEQEEIDFIKNRVKVVLNKMKDLGKIKTEEEYNAAIAEVDSGLKFKHGKIVENVYSYHTDAALTQIINELMEENDWSYERARLYLFSSGFTIYTTENPDIQKVMNEEFAKTKYKIKSAKGQTSQAGMALIDHKTGYVLAIAGQLGEKTDSFGLNRATQITKQTGSSMKPVAVLSPAINQGVITAATTYDDVQTRFGGKLFKNYGNYQGLITMRKAVALSQNMPFLHSMTALGPEKSMEYLESVGIDNLVEADNNISLALGGLTIGTSPLKMAGAYAAIANDGEYITPTLYTKVTDKNGNTVKEVKQERRTVMSKAAAYVIQEMLTECVRNGTSPYCSISGMSVAAKTGTTNDDFDRWLCGFTPYYTAATWFGYDQNEEVNYRGSPGNPAAGLWIGVMRPIHEDLDGERFSATRPDGVTTAAVCNVSGLLPTDLCKKDPRGASRIYTEFFVEGTVPTKRCETHVEVEICETSKLLATEFCPKKTKGVYIKKGAGSSGGADSKYVLKVTEECKTHTEPSNARPVITLNGSNNITLNINEKYNEQGATAKDEIDGDLTNKIARSGSVNTAVSGTYVITYSVTNSIGNETKVTRTVIVKAAAVVPKKPTITLNGAATMELTVRRRIYRPSERKLLRVMEKI